MSETERKKRLDYKKNRKKWIIIGASVLLAVTLLVLAFSITFYQLNKTYYIDYSESSEVDYKVFLKENDFYEEDWLGKDQAYVAALIKNVIADLEYELSMDAKNVDFEYTYKIDATLNIVVKGMDKPIFNPTYALKEEQKLTQNSNNKLLISEQVIIDYMMYNDIATSFIDTYQLADATSTLVVEMSVNVISSGDDLMNNEENQHVVSLNIPLSSKALDIEISSSVPQGETKVLACENGTTRNVFKCLSIGLSALDVALLCVFVAFVFLTRNHDINYSIKLKKLLSGYKSFIQTLKNKFDTKGYQVLFISSFTEMLEIRDTIQSPVLMYENKDQTCARFVIPTSTKLLYMYELKVENYDEIYSAEDAVDECAVVEETPVETVASAPAPAPVISAVTANENHTTVIVPNGHTAVVVPKGQTTTVTAGDNSTTVETAPAPEPRAIDVINNGEIIEDEDEIAPTPTDDNPTPTDGAPVTEDSPAADNNATVGEATVETAPVMNEGWITEEIIEDGNTDDVPTNNAVEETVANETVVEETVVEETVVEETVVEETVVEEAVANETVVEEAVVEEAPVEEAPVEEAVVEEAVVEETPVEEAVVEETVVEEIPVEGTVVEEAVVEETPVEEAVVEEIPVEGTVVEEAVVEEAVVEEAVVEEAVVEEAVVEEAVVEEAVVEEAVVEEAVVEEAVVEEAVVEEAVVEEAVVEEAPVEETVVEEPPVEGTVVEEAVVEEAVVEEAVVEETPVEEAVANETVVEETVVEEIPVEEAVVEEAPVTDEVKHEAYVIEGAIEEDGVLVDAITHKPIITPTYYDNEGNKIEVGLSRSFTANLIQSEETEKQYYSELKNHILSYKGVKSRISWKFDTFNRGRDQLFKLKIRGKTIYLYCALDPESVDKSKYRQEAMDSKLFESVPMLIKIKSALGLRKAKEIVDMVMEKFQIPVNPKAKTVDYVAENPYEDNEALLLRKLIKILIPDANVVIVSTKPKTEEKPAESPVEEEAKAEEIIPTGTGIILVDGDADPEVIENALHLPEISLDDIDYIDEIDEDFDGDEEHPSAEIIGVVWPEKIHKNKIYRYDPNGEKINDGDVVLVPTTDAYRNKEVIRKAAVAHGNHSVDPSTLSYPLKKVIAIIKRKDK